MDRIDAKINEILKFIAAEFAKLGGDKKRKELAKEWGLRSSKNINDFEKYAHAIDDGELPNPTFRLTYRILAGIMKRPPISFSTPGPPIRPENYVPVPMVEGRIAAGPGLIVHENIHELIGVYKEEIGHRKNLVAVRLASDADSMKPTLFPGDIVIIDRDDKQIVPHGIYAVRVDQEGCSLKRIRIARDHFILLSDNPDYPAEISELSNLDDLIVGRVTWSWKSWA